MEENQMSRYLIEKALTNPDHAVRVNAIKQENISKIQLMKAMHDGSVEVREAVAESPKATKEVIDFLIGDQTSLIRGCVARSNLLTDEQICQLIQDPHPYVRRQIAKHGNLSERHISTLIIDSDWDVRKNTVKYHDTTVEQIDYILHNDISYQVRLEAIQDPNILKDHLLLSLGDERIEVRDMAVELLKERFPEPVPTPEPIVVVEEKSFTSKVASFVIMVDWTQKTTSDDVEMVLDELWSLIYFKGLMNDLDDIILYTAISELTNELIVKETSEEVVNAIEKFFDVEISSLSINHKDMMDKLGKSIFTKLKENHQ